METGACDAVRARLEEALAAHDRPSMISAALDAVSEGRIDVPSLYICVLTPLMNDLGDRWQEGGARVWEEHLASEAVRDIIDALYPTVLKLKAGAQPLDRSVLLACPENEGHDLGLRMLSDLFDLAGWTTYLLGADTPALEIADAAETLGVELVLLAATTHFHRVRLPQVLHGLHEALPATRIVVTGGAFSHDTEGLRSDEVFRPGEFFPWPVIPSPDAAARRAERD